MMKLQCNKINDHIQIYIAHFTRSLSLFFSSPGSSQKWKKCNNHTQFFRSINRILYKWLHLLDFILNMNFALLLARWIHFLFYFFSL